MRILLLYPPHSFLHGEEGYVHTSPPLGLAYIGAVLERAGYDVKAIDCVIENWGKKVWETHHLSCSSLARTKDENPERKTRYCWFDAWFLRNLKMQEKLLL